MRIHAHIMHSDKACNHSRANMKPWPQLSQRQIYELSRKFYSTLRFPLLDGIMAALLFVGYLCCEECTSDRGGSLWQFQTASNTLCFLSHSFQFCPSFPSVLDPDSKHQYCCVYGQVHVLSLNTGKYILLPPSETVYWLRRTTDLTYAFFIFCGGSQGRQNFFHLSCFQSTEIFVVYTKVYNLSPRCWKMECLNPKGLQQKTWFSGESEVTTVLTEGVV